MSSNFNELNEETKKNLYRNYQVRKTKEAQTKRKENSERQNEMDILLDRYDPNYRLDRDRFKSHFSNFKRTLKRTLPNRSSLQYNVNQFINSLPLDKFDGLLRYRLDKETKEFLNQMLGKSSYSGSSFYIQNKKKNNGKLKKFDIYLDYLQGRLRLPSAEEKRIRDKIKKLQRKVDEDYSKLGKLDDKNKQQLLQDLIELGVLKNLRDEKNNATNPENTKIMRVIDHLKSCEKEILEVILRDLNSKMFQLQRDYSRIKDKVVKKNLEKLVSDYKVNSLLLDKSRNNNVSESIKGIVSSPQFINLENEIKKYQKILKETRKIIEESVRKNPFKKINKLKGSEAKVYKMTKAIEKIIKEINEVLQKAKGKMKSSSSSSGLRRAPSMSPSMSSRFGRLQQRRI